MGWAEDVKRKAALDRNIDAALRKEEAVVRDERGRPLEVGDEVLVLEPGSSCRVASITPILDPGVPPGWMRLRLVSIREINTPANAVVEGIVRTRTVSEFGVPADPSTAPPPVDEPPKEPIA